MVFRRASTWSILTWVIAARRMPVSIPTATFFIDVNVGSLYSALRCLIHRQEAEDVTSVSDRRGRVFYSPIGPDPQRCGRLHAGIGGVSYALPGLLYAAGTAGTFFALYGRPF